MKKITLSFNSTKNFISFLCSKKFIQVSFKIHISEILKIYTHLMFTSNFDHTSQLNSDTVKYNNNLAHALNVSIVEPVQLTTVEFLHVGGTNKYFIKKEDRRFVKSYLA